MRESGFPQQPNPPPQAPMGCPKTFASSVPAITCPAGEEEEKICGGDVGIRRCLDAVLWRLSIRCAFHKRKRSPQQISFFRIPRATITPARN